MAQFILVTQRKATNSRLNFDNPSFLFFFFFFFFFLGLIYIYIYIYMKSLSTWVSPTDFVTILSHYPCVFVSRFIDFVTPFMCFLFLFFIVVSLVKHCLKCYMNKTWNGYDFFWCPLYILLLPTSPRKYIY